jgi:tRNA nucleotidyltransferase (CCA-adding enzyme)
MDLVLCHTTADFDTLGAAVGLTRLHPGARIVLAGGEHAAVRSFLALHRDEYPLIERRSVLPEKIRTLFVVDTQRRARLGKVAEWLDLPQVKMVVYDHHADAESDIATEQRVMEPVGAVTTLIVEQLQEKNLIPNPMEATVMALGIHVDTGSLTFDHATPRDARALAWLMEQGANLRAIAEYTEPGLSPQLQSLLTIALDQLQTETLQGYTLAWVLLDVEGFTPGLSSLVSRLMEITEIDALLLAAQYSHKSVREAGDGVSVSLIGRSRIENTNLNALFKPLGGGGHPRAVAANLHHVNPPEILDTLVGQLKAQLPYPPTARDLMSSPVRTVRPEITIGEAQRVLLRYGHSGLSVVDAAGNLVGVISRRDLDIALHHGFSHAPVKGYMTTNLKTITPDTSLPEIEALMVTYDIGRLPVLEDHQLLGIVTRTDVLRQLHRQGEKRQEARIQNTGVRIQKLAGSGEQGAGSVQTPNSKLQTPNLRIDSLLGLLRQALVPEQMELLEISAQNAEARGWQLFLVGGAVRDLLLARMNDTTKPMGRLLIEDIDLVVDGFHQTVDVGAGVELARSLQERYPPARLEIHGKFQTAALLWHNDPTFKSLWIDIATARTEFYPYPAANPEVEASSIEQDLYRRDFTINALALRLTTPRSGELLDFFGGVLDLQAKQIRVLHANSFIEDPTRIYRAVRFAVRLGFQIDTQTEGYIRHAIASGIYRQMHECKDPKFRAPALQTRLKAELKYILQAPYWQSALHFLENLGALQCIHPTLEPNRDLWRQLRLSDRCLKSTFSTPHAGSTDAHGESPRPTPIRLMVPLRLRREPSAERSLNTLTAKAHSPLPHWLLLLEIILTHVGVEYRAEVARNFQLPTDSIERLNHLATAQMTLLEQLPTCDRPSQIVRCLQEYDTPMLLLIAICSDRTLRRIIWQYLTQWSNVKSPLDGNDLKALGYKPGHQFKQILAVLTAAKLDGLIGDRTTAETFLTTHHPISSLPDDQKS